MHVNVHFKEYKDKQQWTILSFFLGLGWGIPLLVMIELIRDDSPEDVWKCILISLFFGACQLLLHIVCTVSSKSKRKFMSSESEVVAWGDYQAIELYERLERKEIAPEEYSRRLEDVQNMVTDRLYNPDSDVAKVRFGFSFMMKRCPKCWSIIASNADKCRYCGAAVHVNVGVSKYESEPSTGDVVDHTLMI